MKLPPLFMRLQLAPNSGFPSLFIPLFLLWLPALLLLLPLLVIAVAVGAVLDPARLPRWLALFWSIYAVLCATRGTHVEVRGLHVHVVVSVF